MFAKSTKLGLVSRYAVAAVTALALGGCAEAVGPQRSTTALTRTASAFPEIVLPNTPAMSDEFSKSDKLERTSAVVPSKLGDTALARSGVGYRTEPCGH